MRNGWQTSEFWLTAWLYALAVGAVAHLCHAPPATWPAALAVGAPLAVLIWMTGAIVNNYSENRFRLKARQAQEKQEGPGILRGPFGFGSRIAAESPNEEG